MESLEETKTRIKGFIQEIDPTVDLAPGSVLNELIVKLGSYVQNAIYNEIQDLKAQASIITASSYSDEEQVDTIIDQIASNYNVTRLSETKSTGVVRVRVSQNKSYQLPTTFRLYQPSIDKYYVTTQAYSIQSEGGDIQLKTEGDGTFYFLLPVEAEEAGTSSQLSQGTILTLSENQRLSQFVSAEANTAFTSGRNNETNTSLISRLQQGLSTKTLTTPVSIKARLQELYPSIKSVSVVGAGSDELRRSKHNLFGVDTLGMVDVYIRSTNAIEQAVLTKGPEAAPQTGRRKVTLTAEDGAAGFYRVIGVYSNSGSTRVIHTITDITYGVSIPDSSYTNYIVTSQEARFSTYQQVEIEFEVSESAVPTEVEVQVDYQPNIKEIQDLFLSEEERIPCADYLVKAVIPCFVTVDVKIQLAIGTTVDTNKIREDIFDYINSISTGDSVNASDIVKICHQYDIKRVNLPMILRGSIYQPNGILKSISSNDSLVIPSDTTNSVSTKTTQFFVSLSDINITTAN